MVRNDQLLAYKDQRFGYNQQTTFTQTEYGDNADSEEL